MSHDHAWAEMVFGGLPTTTPILREIFGGDVFPLAAGGQIALRFPLPAEEAAAAAARPLPLRWGGHLDGLHTPLNGVPKGGPH